MISSFRSRKTFNKSSKRTLKNFKCKNKRKSSRKYLNHFRNKGGSNSSISGFNFVESLVKKENINYFNYIFDNPSNFTSIQGDKTTLSNQGENGIVYKLEYFVENANEQSNSVRNQCAVLKVPIKKSDNESDNLAYEYLVGKNYINHIEKYFPCFLHTYGLYCFKNSYFRLEFAEENEFKFTAGNLTGNFFRVEETQQFYKTVCDDYTRNNLCLLIEYLDNSIMMSKEFTKQNFSFDIVYVLLQIYYPLVILNKWGQQLTHYDLHTDNIMLQKLDNDCYIEYHYHYTNESNKEEKVVFKSKYLAKIIDYGRCYFYKNEENNSKTIYEKICNTQECKNKKNDSGKCGQEKGFGEFPLKNNTSQDIRTIYKLQPPRKTITNFIKSFFTAKTNTTKIQNNKGTEELKGIEELKNLIKNVKFDGEFKIKEVHNTSFKKKYFYFSTIVNIFDAFVELMKLAANHKDINEQMYEGKTKIGDMYVYDNKKEYIFVPYSSQNNTSQNNTINFGIRPDQIEEGLI